VGAGTGGKQGGREVNSKQWLIEMQKLMNRCPAGHWLFAADGGLYLMHCDSEGKQIVNPDGGMSQDAIVGQRLTGPVVDGGDW